MKKIFLLIMVGCVLSAGSGLRAADAALDGSGAKPKLVKKMSPVYPEEAFKKKIEGVVQIEATSDEEGNVVAAKVLPAKDPQPLLEETALVAVRQWKYEPFLVNGKAVGVTFTVTMKFALNQDEKQDK